MQLLSLLKTITRAVPEQQAWWLLEKLTGKSRSKLITQDEIDITSEQLLQLQDWLEEIVINSQPIQYIIGSVPFYEIEILCKPPVLIPRPETEEWVVQLIQQLQPYKDRPLRILDLCTGSGCIGLALAHALPNAHVIMSDIAEHALMLAQENKLYNSIPNSTILPSNLFETVGDYAPFDIIVSNPPYIPMQAYKHLDSSVKEWEDRLALEAGKDGLSIIKKIIEVAPNYLSSRDKAVDFPQLLIEIDYTQAEAVTNLLKHAGFNQIAIDKDLYNKDRVVRASL
ncbi:protein-(glutamine-N5) methyltransferase, release factor-specific [candidate division TM6 bacterium RIFCSPHIGHO2_12_FULL_36_22]|nr:MAG: protein-(glutamine-N5) methyltransferase, release factor-specific [candidate division TM6 bacterium RIFCSPHIGHO2_12_FULL_36_22]